MNILPRGHDVIWANSELFVIGGQFERRTEKCHMIDGKFECEYLNLNSLEEYAWYPISFIVDEPEKIADMIADPYCWLDDLFELFENKVKGTKS